MFLRLLCKFKLYLYKKQGLQISDDCRIMGIPNFGSEPYLVSIGKQLAEMFILLHMMVQPGYYEVNQNANTLLNTEE